MSGWNLMDKSMEENTGDSFPAQNNITIAGYLPSDQVPQSGECPSILTPKYSKVALRRRGALQEFTSLQKVVSIHALYYRYARVQEVHQPRNVQATAGTLLARAWQDARHHGHRQLRIQRQRATLQHLAAGRLGWLHPRSDRTSRPRWCIEKLGILVPRGGQIQKQKQLLARLLRGRQQASGLIPLKRYLKHVHPIHPVLHISASLSITITIYKSRLTL